MDRFLPQGGALNELINSKATELFNKLKSLPVADLQIPEQCRHYLASSHLSRLFFSIQTSAHLLQRAITKKALPVEEIVLMDYGAGVGTLYLLAKAIGCNKVVYNDHLEDWKISAKVIAEAIGIHIDEYIVGDIDHTMQECSAKSIQVDIITSRNVVEHIYNLEDFFSTVYRYAPNALIFNSTTANFKNPASRVKHILWHKKWEKHYRQDRLKIITAKGINGNAAELLATATRGLALNDLDEAIELYRTSKRMPDPSRHRSNTCDPSNGVWAEHMISFEEYKAATEDYYISFEPGFWDTHYSSSVKNMLGTSMNKIGSISKGLGFTTASFIYVIAEPKKYAGKEYS